MEAGVAVTRITPPLGVSMGGYAHRTHGAESVADDLTVKALALALDGRRAVLLTADLLWLRRECADAVKATLEARYGLPPEAVLVSCTHTHSGPQTAADTPGIGGPDPDYLPRLLAAAADTVGRALEALRPAGLTLLPPGRGALGVNRRVVTGGRARMLPNPSGPRDDEVLAFLVDAGGGEPLATVFQYACHPTCLGGYALSADFPGAAMRRVESEVGGTCLFVQGCCGDVRPHVVGPDGRFRQATVEEAHALGAALGDEVVRLVRAGGGEPVPPGLGGRLVEVGLEFAALPSVETLRAVAAGQAAAAQPRAGAEWARLLLAQPARLAPAAPFRLHRLDLGANLTLLGMEGEVCVGYGLEAKRLGRERGLRVLPGGYANGCLAYIPTAEMFPEGGYEVDESFPFFGMPAPFTPRIDGRLRGALRALLDRGA